MALTVLTCLGLLAAGCGGDDSGSDSDSPAASADGGAGDGTGEGKAGGSEEEAEGQGKGDGNGGGDDPSAQGGDPNGSADRGSGEASAGRGSGGGFSGSGSSPSGSTGKVEFVREANEICAERRVEMLTRVQSYVEENAQSGKSQAKLQAESIDSIVIPNMEMQVREIGELAPPPGEAAEVRAFLAAMEDGIATTRRKDRSAETAKDFGDEYRRAGKLAEGLGLASCSFGR